MVGAVVGEYLGSAAGLGYLIQQAEGVFDVAGVFAGMFVLAVFVVVIDMHRYRWWRSACWSGGRWRRRAALTEHLWSLQYRPAGLSCGALAVQEAEGENFMSQYSVG